MADNVTTQSSTLATIPASTVIETDQLVSGAHVQKIKLMDGTADSTEVIQGSAANGLEVDVTRVSGNVAVTGTFWQATQPISAASLPLPTGAATAALQGGGLPAALGAGGGLKVDGSGTALPVSIAATVTVDSELTTADLDTGGGTDTRAVVGLVLAKSGGAANVSSTDPLPVAVISGGGGGTQYTEDSAHASGDTGTLMLAKRTDSAAVSSGTDGDYSTVNVDNEGRVYTRSVAESHASVGGLSIYHLITSNTTNVQSVKASAGQVYSIQAFSIDVIPVYLKFHNTASTPTAGSGVVWSCIIPANSTGSGVIIPLPHPLTFGTGIGISVVAGILDSDATALTTANKAIINLGYK